MDPSLNIGVLRGILGVGVSSLIVFGICFLVLAILVKKFPEQFSKKAFIYFGLVVGLIIVLISGFEYDTAGVVILCLFSFLGMIGSYVFSITMNSN